MNGKDVLLRRLQEIPEPPETLHERGTYPDAQVKTLAVVGSRALSRYGQEACEKLISGLSGYPISIISGLALGADACAHKTALYAGLHTIAVPGSGLNQRVMYPRTNAKLAEDIVRKGGLLLSEHEDMHRARPEDFPSRNRIMVGLADAVLVIEAGPQSGTLITARLTHEYNRELLCIPHRIGDPHGYGNHLFIRLGATLVTESEHILQALNIDTKEKRADANVELTEKEQIILAHIKEGKEKDVIIRTSPLPPSETLSALLSLELKGVAKEEFGLWKCL